MASGNPTSLWQDESGAAFVEFTAGVLTFFLLLFGIVEFSYAFYQWNAATKATQLGARLAAVSEPAYTGFRNITGVGTDPVTGIVSLPGDPMPAFDFTCTKDGTGCDNNALRLIVFGRCDAGETCTEATINGTKINVRSACNPNSSTRNVGMCNVFSRINGIDKISIRYEYTGLGYAGRPGGPVPTITLSLINMRFEFVLLAAFLPTNFIDMPSFSTTVTGEDLNASWSS